MFDSCRKEIEVIALASVAGLLGYLMRTIRKGKKLRLLNVLVEMASSGLVGYLVFLLCKAMKLEDAWVGPIVGVFGWVGASSSILAIERVVFRRLGVDNVAPQGQSTTDNDGT